MKQLAALLFLSLTWLPSSAQILVDSIPYPGINQGFWGIHVNADTVFLGADFSGDIYFSDHNGTILGQLPTANDFNHGMIRTATGYLVAEDFTTGGAHLYEIDNTGTTTNTWTFPDVIGGHSSGIGDLCADGNAVWYTMYYPDFPNDPYAYAYKWVPGAATAIDTVPMHGEQPYGIALKGDTLFYVTDNLNGDQERVHAYDLSNEVDLGWIELPDTPIDNDQRPQGMYYDGEFLYLVANRQGNNISAYQTVFIYAFDGSTAFAEVGANEALLAYPNPAGDRIVVEVPFSRSGNAGTIQIFDATGRQVWNEPSPCARCAMDVSHWEPGIYLVKGAVGDHRFTSTFVVEH